LNVSSQLVLDFEHRPALGGEDFLVAPCNADAVAWLDKWPDWPGPGLVVLGYAGSGKTHLGQVFLSKASAINVSAEMLSGNPPPEGKACLVEDVDKLLGSSEGTIFEEPLLHLFNWTRENNSHLLMTASIPPSKWRMELADLSSRFKALQTVEIGEPDDTLLSAVLVKQFADRQLRIDADVLGYILPRMERTFAAARQLVVAADTVSLQEQRRITIPLMRQIL